MAKHHKNGRPHQAVRDSGRPWEENFTGRVRPQWQWLRPAITSGPVVAPTDRELTAALEQHFPEDLLARWFAQGDAHATPS